MTPAVACGTSMPITRQDNVCAQVPKVAYYIVHSYITCLTSSAMHELSYFALFASCWSPSYPPLQGKACLCYMQHTSSTTSTLPLRHRVLEHTPETQRHARSQPSTPRNFSDRTSMDALWLLPIAHTRRAPAPETHPPSQSLITFCNSMDHQSVPQFLPTGLTAPGAATARP